MESPDTFPAAGPEAAVASAPRPPRTLRNSLKWAVLVPVLLTLGAWLAQYPYGGIVLGVIVSLATVAVAAIVAGGAWHRAGAAVLVCCSGFALMLFAGPGLYELYMKAVGEPVPAVVTKVQDRKERLYCTVAETGGDHKVREISQQQNCFDHIKPLQRVTLRADPLGVLDPRLPDGPGQPGLDVTLMISAGLFVLTGGAMFYAGRRRR